MPAASRIPTLTPFKPSRAFSLTPSSLSTWCQSRRTRATSACSAALPGPCWPPRTVRRSRCFSTIFAGNEYLASTCPARPSAAVARLLAGAPAELGLAQRSGRQRPGTRLLVFGRVRVADARHVARRDAPRARQKARGSGGRQRRGTARCAHALRGGGVDAPRG